MAGPGGQVDCKKKCVCGPFYRGGKLNYPLWWYGEKGVLYNFAGLGSYVVPTNCVFMNHGYYFNGGNSHLLDEQNRKILRECTLGLWSSINLDCNNPPSCGSITGSGTRICLNDGDALPPKIGGSLVLHPQRCPNLTALSCYSNSISILNVSALTNLTTLYCYNNSISILNVSALTNLTHLSCGSNSISILDVSALTNLTALSCYSNSISILNVSALTNLTYLSCGSNSISILDVSALTNLTTLYCYNNSMNQAMVDTVLCDMDAHGINNGTLNISNNVVPSAAGVACKNNLLARGWTVTTD